MITEIFEELQKLADWEGCELGSMCYDLMELYSTARVYASPQFVFALETELREHYETIKDLKAEEDAEDSLNKLDTCVAISINGMTTHFTTETRVDSLEQLPAILREYLTSLESPELTDPDLD